MADSDTSTVAPGVTRRQCFWGYYLEGSKDALIASGLAHADWFIAPGERDKRGRVARSKKLKIDGHLVETRVPDKGPAFVGFHYTAQERERAEQRPEPTQAPVI